MTVAVTRHVPCALDTTKYVCVRRRILVYLEPKETCRMAADVVTADRKKPTSPNLSARFEGPLRQVRFYIGT